ncbi:hypothetical protein A2962_04465 [Candidatus Woesebacteria bacterium RIFCSPLOWO2_01_FULL_39_61]|uniref:Uncharacterized protein n=1 Tax=Candidatus Woesebacteria bacterium RIFCSPHIGHO2_02_FULL_39_13 TaxID=1802505 RepID=A0A1F7Z0M9_9BACT|nr:MAG: hypothetical protein A2692_00920 [Candidatus Woesebacteria bacterium RIFCSPHIGHO2_01_FULL_39_95]OGM33102.1 MAG: hypothetical protein A3D01_05070 [Candidatus Woesebacteria bacterium RIFCSPHIGHO2_02_FULL_39_13]OGM38054.1 MAG: hypothetical protein A3E13_03735 [Candidatus Woesebacteria bacterium RIFCSPHIGHO2_12_FULL_40_20]OGM66576.1 MAG: hypothetical protein A2962_04465 [Candidatus Woesebacteria bacterium RIFCSPLOWO2_01_FULL_39_61]OGM73766.1 MAG: hypothetical protein A3H19_02060 [Candidatus
MYPLLKKTIEVWEKSGSGNLSDVELFEAAEELVQYFYKTLVTSQPALLKYDGFKNKLKVLGKVGIPAIASDFPLTDQVKLVVKDQLGIDFSPEKHVFVHVPTQITGSSLFVVFQLPD